MKRCTTLWLFTCLFLAASLGTWADTQRQLPRYARLTILHTNDVHGQMLPFNYGDETDVGGVARRATMINSMRSRSRDTVLALDGGDIFDRGPLDKVYHGEPDFAILNAIPYDALALGNNEFDGAPGMEGQKILFDRIRQARIPVVCANCTYKATGKTIALPYVILERNGIRFGIFGLTAPRVATYTTVEGLAIEDPIQCAKRIVPELKRQADVVIGLTHIGYGLDKQLAAQVPDIDIIIGGDSHTWVLNPELVKTSDQPQAFWVGGTVIAQDGEWGKCLGEVNAILRLQGEHDYQVMSFKGELVPVKNDVPDSKGVDAILRPYVRPFERVFGQSAQGVTKPEMPGLLAEIYQSVGGTQVGISQNNVALAGIPKGPVTRYDLMKIPAYNNQIVTGSVPGSALQALSTDPSVTVRGPAPDPGTTYTVCTQDFLTIALKPLKGIEFKPIGKTILDVLNEYVSGQMKH